MNSRKTLPEPSVLFPCLLSLQLGSLTPSLPIRQWGGFGEFWADQRAQDVLRHAPQVSWFYCCQDDINESGVLTEEAWKKLKRDRDTELPLTDYQVYVALTDLIISVRNNQECKTSRRIGDRDLLWWSHRRNILREGTDKRKSAQWLVQDKKEMEELAARYPVPGMLSRRPFMMPAIDFR